MLRVLSIFCCFIVAVIAMPEKLIRSEITLLEQSLTKTQKQQFMDILSDSNLSENQADEKIDEFIATLNDTQQEWHKVFKQRHQLSIEEDKAFRLERIAEMPESYQKIANEIEKLYDDRNISIGDKKAQIKEMKNSLPVEIRDEFFPVYSNVPILIPGFLLERYLKRNRG